MFPELIHSVVNFSGKALALPLPSDREHRVIRSGRATHKDKIKAILNSCYEVSSSTESFLERVRSYGLKTYIRGGRVYGVISDGRKYRFKTLGFTGLYEIDRSVRRERELKEIRKRQKGRSLER